CPKNNAPRRGPRHAPPICLAKWDRQSAFLGLRPVPQDRVEMTDNRPRPLREFRVYPGKPADFRQPWLLPEWDELLRFREPTHKFRHFSAESSSHRHRPTRENVRWVLTWLLDVSHRTDRTCCPQPTPAANRFVNCCRH